MKKKVIPLVSLGLLLACGILVGVFWNPIIDWLPIDQSGWEVMENGGKCYLDENGDPITGWHELDNHIYYFDPESYAMQIRWLELDEGRYYLGYDGVRRTGWQEIGGNRYYLGDDGAMVTGWLQQDAGMMYLNENGNPHTDWLELDDTRYYLDKEGLLYSGWLEQEEGKYHLGDDGIPQTGWQEIDGNFYYFDESGIMQTGWMELDGNKYYLKDNGTAAKGRLVIDEKTYYFTSTGANIMLVNRWNPLPWDFAPEITECFPGCWMSTVCSDAAQKMLTDLQAATGDTGLLNGYRSYSTQYNAFYGSVNSMVQEGHSHSFAFETISRSIALPGCSEHQLGLAVDVMGRYDLFYDYGETEVIHWLKEHCWEYGFILRYPENKSHITGIIYEPWHFRYVGVELAMELKDSGLCLEEYLDALTGDGTTCGNPDALKFE